MLIILGFLFTFSICIPSNNLLRVKMCSMLSDSIKIKEKEKEKGKGKGKGGGDLYMSWHQFSKIIIQGLKESGKANEK